MKRCLVFSLALACAAAQAGDPKHGAELYRTHCTGCHGAAGRPVMPGAPDLTRPTALLKPDQALAQSIRTGRGGMPAYAGVLRERELLDVVTHLRTFR
jgi:cytochrome c6